MDRLSKIPNYQTLSDKGLMLDQESFNTVYQSIKKGVDEAGAYLGIENTSHPEIVFSDSVSSMGYSVELDAVNIPITYLNLIRGNTAPIEFRDQLVCFVPDKFYVIVKFLNWLRLFGHEETIHYFQYHGNPKLNIKFPQKFAESISPKTLLLSSLEVEARKIVNEIALIHNEPPIWKNIDDYFSAKYPEYYDKSLEDLTKLPKTDLEISFEMENLLT